MRPPCAGVVSSSSSSSRSGGGTDGPLLRAILRKTNCWPRACADAGPVAGAMRLQPHRPRRLKQLFNEPPPSSKELSRAAASGGRRMTRLGPAKPSRALARPLTRKQPFEEALHKSLPATPPHPQQLQQTPNQRAKGAPTLPLAQMGGLVSSAVPFPHHQVACFWRAPVRLVCLCDGLRGRRAPHCCTSAPPHRVRINGCSPPTSSDVERHFHPARGSIRRVSNREADEL
jgi:hypothetical protein